MLLRRICVLLLCGLIAGGAVLYTVTFRFFDRPLTQAKQVEFQERIRLPDNFTLAASVNSVATVKNTLESARKNVRDGSYALELNVTFAPDGTLFLADGPEYLTDASVTLESVFKEFRDTTYLRYVLRLMNNTEDPILVDLAVKYKLFGRIMLIGISPDELSLYNEQYCNFMLCAQLEASDVKMSDRDACVEALQHCIENGAGAVLCHQADVTNEFCDALTGFGQLRFVLDGVDSNYEMYHALSLNPNIIITAHPEILFNMMLSQDYLNLNKSNSF